MLARHYLGQIGEELAVGLLKRARFRGIRNLNHSTPNHPWADIYAKRYGTRYVISVKARNRVQANGEPNRRAKIGDDPDVPESIAASYNAVPAFLVIVLDERHYNAWFGTMDQLLSAGLNGRGIPIGDESARRYGFEYLAFGARHHYDYKRFTNRPPRRSRFSWFGLTLKTTVAVFAVIFLSNHAAELSRWSGQAAAKILAFGQRATTQRYAAEADAPTQHESKPSLRDPKKPDPPSASAVHAIAAPEVPDTPSIGQVKETQTGPNNNILDVTVIEAVDLVASFDSNKEQATQKYGGKVLVLRGVLEKAGKDFISLKDKRRSRHSLRCNGAHAEAAKGKVITIRGVLKRRRMTGRLDLEPCEVVTDGTPTTPIEDLPRSPG